MFPDTDVCQDLLEQLALASRVVTEWQAFLSPFHPNCSFPNAIAGRHSLARLPELWGAVTKIWLLRHAPYGVAWNSNFGFDIMHIMRKSVGWTAVDPSS